MFEKTIKFLDFDENEREETFYFHLSKPEIIELELSKEGGLQKYIQKISSSQNQMLIIELFKDIITRSYGEKSPDGRRFIKNKEVLENFTQTAAYSELYMELAFNTEAAKKFINGVIPESININIPSDNNIHALPGSAPVDGVILPK